MLLQPRKPAQCAGLQQLKGTDSLSSTLLSCDPTWVLCLALGSPANKRHGPPGASPEKGSEDDQMAVE